MPRLAVIATLLVLTGCSNNVVPREGYWVGDHFSFELKNSTLFNIMSRGITCSGGLGCFADGNRVYPGVTVDITGNSFSARIEKGGVILTFSGTFVSSTRVEGQWEFMPQDKCCSSSGSWYAEFVRGYEDVTQDVYDTKDIQEDIQDVEEAERPDGHIYNLYPEDASDEQIQAIVKVAELRQKLGLQPIIEVEELNLAAQAHADYFMLHCANYKTSGLSPHLENKDWAEGFTGETFADRMVHFGFTGQPGWEVMAFYGDPIAAIDGWLETLYHRIPFVHPNAEYAGYGGDKGACYNWSSGVDVMDFSRKPNADRTEPVFYPYDGQTNVKPWWDGSESPTPPLPPGHSFPTGPVITVTFPSGYKFEVTEHVLEGPEGVVEHQFVTPQTDPNGLLQDTVALYALSPLQPNTTYKVTIKANYMGKERVWEWKFTTGTQSYPF